MHQGGDGNKITNTDECKNDERTNRKLSLGYDNKMIIGIRVINKMHSFEKQLKNEQSKNNGRNGQYNYNQINRVKKKMVNIIPTRDIPMVG